MSKTNSHNFHEDFQDRHTGPKMPSDRAFGFTLGGILSAIGLIKGSIFGWWGVGSVFLTIGTGLILAGFFAPALLKRPKEGFVKAAPYIARVVNPILMAVIYIICFIPAGFILKLAKRDPLNRAYNTYAPTYWVKREKHDLPDPMKYQF